MSSPCHAPSPLSVRRSFVVQFRANTQFETERVTGRVEHIASRSAMSFDSLEELMTFMQQVLQETQDAMSNEESE